MRSHFLSAIAVITILASCSTPKKEETGAVTSAPPRATAPPKATVSSQGPAPDSIEYFNTVIGNAVHFDFDKYDIRAEDQVVLRGQAQWLNQHPARIVTVEGYCDERGTREYNLGLGERRANAVTRYLVSLGVNAGRLKTISYGKERPICVTSEESCWFKNRRSASVVQ